MLEQVSTAITFVVFYYDATNDCAKTGLTVTVDVRKVSDGSEIVTGAAATEIGDGLYKYTLASGSTADETLYVAVFKTSDTDVAQRDIPAMWAVGTAGIENLDQSLSTTESNIRGSDSDDLKDISDEIAGLNNLSSAQVTAACTSSLTTYDPPTKDELDAAIAGLNDPTAEAIADQVWDEAKSGHVGAGSFGEEVQAHALSSEIAALNDPSAEEIWAAGPWDIVQAVASTEDVVILRGDTLSVSLTDLGDISGRTKLWVTFRKNREDADTASLFQIEETAGLIYVNGAAASVAGNGAISVTDETDGDLTFTLDEAETVNFSKDTGYWDVQVLDAGDVSTLASGTYEVTQDVTRAIT